MTRGFDTRHFLCLHSRCYEKADVERALVASEAEGRNSLGGLGWERSTSAGWARAGAEASWALWVAGGVSRWANRAGRG